MVSGQEEVSKLQRKLKFGQIGGGRDAFVCRPWIDALSVT